MLLVLKSIDWLFVLPGLFPTVLVHLRQQDFKISKVTKKTYLGGHQEGKMHFLINNVIFIRFNFRATEYCRHIAGRISRDSQWRSVFKLRTLFRLKHDIQLVSNLYQQLYHRQIMPCVGA